MDTDSTDYWQPEAAISDHSLVTKFLQGQTRSMNYRGAFNCLKHAKNFCCKHFKGSQLQDYIILKNIIVHLQAGEIEEKMPMSGLSRKIHACFLLNCCCM